MRAIPLEHFAQIMGLPQDVRADLLEFLAAAPVADRHIDALITQARQAHKRASVQKAAFARAGRSAEETLP